MTGSLLRVPPLERHRVNPITGCWIFIGRLDENGYARQGGENAHRYYYERMVCEVPEGHDLDHACERRSCVNPAHMEPVTELENIRRAREVRLAGRGADECAAGHPFDEGNTTYHARPSGRRVRVCKQCRREANRTGARRPYVADVPVRALSEAVSS